MPLTAGSLLGANLRLVRPLGSGGMGTVWLAHNSALGSDLAVKVLNEAIAGGAEARSRFVQEARGLAHLDSPHVVRVFDFGITDEHEPYFVMELLRGRDLKSAIAARGALPLHEVVVIVKQLCRGLRRAHDLGFVHRDIKPANIFLVESDGEPFVKILDFGIAKRLDDGRTMDLTQTNALMGTPYFMSPEQFVSPKHIDSRSDLWSVGVVAYACVVGALPFVGDTAGALSLAVHRAQFTLPSRAVPNLPAALDAFFVRALQVEPVARFSTARGLAVAFEAAVRGDASPSLAADDATLDASHAIVRSAAPHLTGAGHPAGFGNAPTMSQSSGAPWTASHAPPPASFMHTGGPPPAKKSSMMLWIGILLSVLALGAVAAVFVVPALNDDDGSDSDSSKSRKNTIGNATTSETSATAASSAERAAPKPFTPKPVTPKPVTPKPVTPKPVTPKPVTPKPVTPKPKPAQRYHATGTSCRGLKNKTCSARCCTVGPRDIAQYTPGAAGTESCTPTERERCFNDKGSWIGALCRCMRPICGPGENWTTHQCHVE